MLEHPRKVTNRQGFLKERRNLEDSGFLSGAGQWGIVRRPSAITTERKSRLLDNFHVTSRDICYYFYSTHSRSKGGQHPVGQRSVNGRSTVSQRSVSGRSAVGWPPDVVQFFMKSTVPHTWLHSNAKRSPKISRTLDDVLTTVRKFEKIARHFHVISFPILMICFVCACVRACMCVQIWWVQLYQFLRSQSRIWRSQVGHVSIERGNQ